MADQRSGSILAVDFGNVNTRAVLIDLVEGVYRLIARAETRTTNEFPAGDVRVGLRRAVTRLTDVTGRGLLNPVGEILTPEHPDRSGVEMFIATTSTGRPLRTAVVGLVPEVSVASSRRAAAGTYVHIVETISLADERSEEDQLNALLASRPDLIFIAGGTEGGAREPVLKLARLAALAVTLVQRGHKPSILYAGNSALIPQINRIFKGLTTVFTAPNVRPSLDDEDLESAQLQLARAFDERQAQRGGGFDAIGAMTTLNAVMPTAQSYDLIVDYLGKTLGGGVLAVDVGSAVSTLSASLNGTAVTAIRTDIGLGHSAESLLALVGEPAIERWLPFTPKPNETRHYTLNKILRPATVPETLKGLYQEHALLRAGVQALLDAARPTWPVGKTGVMPPLELIIGAGAALTRTGHPGFNTLLLLDVIQPTGVTRLQADPHGLIAALGALATLNPEAVVQVLDGLSLEQLGTAISVSGQPAAGKTALKVKIITDAGDTLRQEVEGGHLWVYPLSAGSTARVEVSAGRGLTIGGKSRLRFTAEGGSAGLIFDARGRPLALAAAVEGRAAQMPLWVSEVTGDPVRVIEDSGAGEDVAAPEPVEVQSESRPRRPARTDKPAKDSRSSVRGRFGRRSAAPAADTTEDDAMSELNKLRG